MPHLLRSFELDLSCEGSDDVWRERLRALGLSMQDEDWDVALWALPSEGLFGLRVRAHMHRSSKTPTLHMKLSYERLPSKPAPLSVREQSDAVGGYPGIFERFGKAFDNAQFKGDLTTTFIARPQDFERVSRLFPNKTELIGTVFEPKILMGSIDPPIDEIYDIRLSYVSEDVWLIGVSRKILTEFHSGIVDVWEKESWNGLQKL